MEEVFYERPDPTRTYLMHSFPRFGATNDFSTIAVDTLLQNATTDDQPNDPNGSSGETYVGGIIAIGVFFFIIFGGWAALLFVFKYRPPKTHTDFWSGEPLDPKFYSPRFLRTSQYVFAAAAGLFVLISLTAMTMGLQQIEPVTSELRAANEYVSLKVDEVDEVYKPVEEAMLELLETYQQLENSLVEVSGQIQSLIDKEPGEVSSPLGIFGGFVNTVTGALDNNLDSVLSEVQVYVESISGVLESSVNDTAILEFTTGTRSKLDWAQEFEETAEELLDVSKTTRIVFCLGIPTVVTGLFFFFAIGKSIFPGSPIYRRVPFWRFYNVGITVLALLAFVLFICTVALALGATANAGGNVEQIDDSLRSYFSGPDETILALAHRNGASDAVYSNLLNLLSQCELDTTVNKLLPMLKRNLKILDNDVIDSLLYYSDTTLSFVDNTLSTVGVDIDLVSKPLKALISLSQFVIPKTTLLAEILQCQNATLVYSKVAYDATCDSSVNVLTWTFFGFLATTVMGFTMLTFRSTVAGAVEESKPITDLGDHKNEEKRAIEDKASPDTPRTEQEDEAQGSYSKAAAGGSSQEECQDEILALPQTATSTIADTNETPTQTTWDAFCGILKV